MSKNFSKTASRITLKFWPLLILLSVGAAVVSYPKTISLYKNISTDPMDLLPRNYPNVQTLIQVRTKVGNRTRIGIVFESDRPEQTIAYLKGVAERLKEQPYVGKVFYQKIGFDFFNKYKLLFIDLEDLHTIRDRIERQIQKEKLKGLLLDLEEDEKLDFGDLDAKYRNQYSDATRSPYFVSTNKQIYSLYLESKDPSATLKSSSRFYDQVANFLTHEKPEAIEPTLKLYLAGPAKVLEYRALMRDLKIAGIISGICIFLPLLIRFRNPFVVLLIFTPLFLGIPIGFAIGSCWIDTLSIITSFLFAILGGLGIETGIHIFSHYHRKRRAGGSIESALEEIFGSVIRAILTSVASVAVTFLLLIVNDFRGFSEFGLVSGIGLWVIFLLYFTFFPALLVCMEKIHLLKFRPLTEIEGVSFRLPRPWMRWGFVIFAAFSLYSLAAPLFMDFEYDSRRIRADVPEVRIAKAKQRLTATRVNNPAVVIVHSREEAEALKKVFRERKEQDKDSPTIDTARSYYDLVPNDQAEKMKIISEIKRMLSDPTTRLVKGEKKKDLDRFKQALNETKPFTEAEVPQQAKDLFLGKKEVPGTLFFINALPDMELDDGRNAMNFAQDVSKVETPLGTYYPSSDANIFGMVLMTMFQDVPRILLLSLASVILFVWLDFRAVKETVLVVSSILMGVFWLLGVMLLFDIKLNFYNMVIIPTVMGASIDNAIHIVHHYEELGRGSLRQVLSSTGVSCLLASLTNAAGFVGLLFTIHRGLYSIGLLAVLGVGTCLLSTLVFLPAVLHFLENRSRAADQTSLVS